MPDPKRLSELSTHSVTNQPPPFPEFNWFEANRPLCEALDREGAPWARDPVSAFGTIVGRHETMAWGEQANQNPPELHIFDRYGYRIDEVTYHPAYHALMSLAVEHHIPSLPWVTDQPGGHVTHTALEYLLGQVESGVCCPITMTYASVPLLRNLPDLAKEWEPRLTTAQYDPS